MPTSACLWLRLNSAEGQKRYYLLQPPFCEYWSILICKELNKCILQLSVRIQSRLNVFEDIFQEAIELPVMRAVEHGFVEHYKRSCHNALVQEFGNIDDSTEEEILPSFRQATIVDLYFMFSCIGIGLSISCIMFAGELLFNKHNMNSRFHTTSDLCNGIFDYLKKKAESLYTHKST